MLPALNSQGFAGEKYPSTANLNGYQANQQGFDILTQHTFSELTNFEKVLKEAEKLLDLMKDAYYKHRLDEAYRKLQACESLKAHLTPEEKARFDEFLKREEKIITDIKHDNQYLHELIKELDYDEGWTVERSGDLKILFKKDPATNIISLRMEAEVEIPLINMITLINEVDLWPHWVAFVRKATEVKAIHRGARIYYLEAGLPYPLPNRDIHIYGTGVNRLYENGSVMIMAKSVNNDPEFFKHHDAQKVEKPGSVYVDIHQGAFEVKPLGPNRIAYRAIAHANPNFSWIPDSVINFAIRKASGIIFNKIVEHAKKFKGSMWEKETQKPEKRDFYDWLNGEVDGYFEREAILKGQTS